MSLKKGDTRNAWRDLAFGPGPRGAEPLDPGKVRDSRSDLSVLEMPTNRTQAQVRRDVMATEAGRSYRCGTCGLRWPTNKSMLWCCAQKWDTAHNSGPHREMGPPTPREVLDHVRYLSLCPLTMDEVCEIALVERRDVLDIIRDTRRKAYEAAGWTKNQMHAWVARADMREVLPWPTS